MTGPALLSRLPDSPGCAVDVVLGRFLEFVSKRGLDLYPAQEEAILALYDERNVILGTPTGSGKSLVATAFHFLSMARGRRSVYTCPIKALVNEKFLALCRDFGPQNVGMATGDATVNRDAPILCCTAEILANHALRDGADAAFRDVIMDEFHYYGDSSRGVAWQVPLLTLARSRFLLLSATLGPTGFFERELTSLTGAPTAVVTAAVRPVPLEYSYVERGLDVTVLDLVAERKAPVYIVHFTQNDAAQTAQDLMSVNVCSGAEKAAIAEELVGVKFTSPYGKEIKRFLRHGIGLHHAGLLPKYRVLVERLAQRGLLKLISGTDTLGMGINVPIRTVLLTRLCKFGGTEVAALTAREFHQIAGRAGRKGFDDIGFVVAMAPAHVIENARLEARAANDPKKARKLVKRKPPEGFVGWSIETFHRLMAATPEPLVSRFRVSHGMLLQVLSRPGDGCRAMRDLISRCHDPSKAKKGHAKRAWQLFRSLVERKIITIVPPATRGAGPKLRLGIDLQEDFSLNHALSLYLIDTLVLLDRDGPDFPLEVMSLVESILENPEIILRRQRDKLRAERMAELKAAGVGFDERVAEVEAIEHPMPGRDFIYNTFNAFAAAHPWVGPENIHPKNVAREMFENFQSFAGFIHEYDLHRTEGILLRHLSNAWKVLARTVPPAFKNETVREMEDWLAGLVRGIDSSLLDEWERLSDPDHRTRGDSGQPPRAESTDITANRREFTALTRAAIFRILTLLAAHNYAAAAAALRAAAPDDTSPSSSVVAWTERALEAALAPYFQTHQRLRLDPEARNLRHTRVDCDRQALPCRVEQTLVDPDDLNDWQVGFQLDLARSRTAGRPVFVLDCIGPIGA